MKIDIVGFVKERADTKKHYLEMETTMRDDAGKIVRFDKVTTKDRREFDSEITAQQELEKLCTEIAKNNEKNGGKSTWVTEKPKESV